LASLESKYEIFLSKNDLGIYHSTPHPLFQQHHLSLKDVHKIPCAREALLYGMGVGAVVGLTRYTVKRKVMTGCNYAVVSFAIVSSLSWEYCRWRLKKQRQEIKTAVIKLNQKKLREVQEHMNRKEKGDSS
jgi:cytochrome c oxidase assembly protein subunit 20